MFLLLLFLYRYLDQIMEYVPPAYLAAVGASVPSDMGKVMGALKAKVAGKADGALVSSLVKAALNK